MDDYIVSYAQNREDIILKAFFEDIEKGFYVDVGAYHPAIASVTKLFYDEGWNGINIEPNQTQFAYFKNSRPRDINLQVGVSDKSGKMKLHEYPLGQSTFSEKIQDEYIEPKAKLKRAHQSYDVDVLTLESIFTTQEVKTINFLKIDVEGFEYEVILGNNWEKYRPQVLCIEADHIIKDWRPLLKKARYDLIFFDGLNEYYVANELPEIAKRFSYVNSMLLGKPILPAYFKGTLDNLNNSLERSAHDFATTTRDFATTTRDLRAQIASLEAQQRANKRIRSLSKQLLVALHLAILSHIEKLNKYKVKQQEPIEISKDMSKDELLKLTKKYDQDRYYHTKTTEPFLYRTLLAMDKGVYKCFKFLVRNAFRVIRRLKNG